MYGLSPELTASLPPRRRAADPRSPRTRQDAGASLCGSKAGKPDGAARGNRFFALSGRFFAKAVRKTSFGKVYQNERTDGTFAAGRPHGVRLFAAAGLFGASGFGVRRGGMSGKRRLAAVGSAPRICPVHFAIEKPPGMWYDGKNEICCATTGRKRRRNRK